MNIGRHLSYATTKYLKAMQQFSKKQLAEHVEGVDDYTKILKSIDDKMGTIKVRNIGYGGE